MAWLDERIWCHPKINPLTDKAFRVYVSSVAYSSGMSTRGYLDAATQRLVGSSAKVRAELVAAGLWDENGDGTTIVIHDWDEHNAARDQKREKDRERKRRWRANHA